MAIKSSSAISGKYLMFFLVAIAGLFFSGQAQNNIYLESNYQLAWGGSTESKTVSSRDGKLVFKSFHWIGKKGVSYPVNIFDARTFRLINQITPDKDMYKMKLSGDGKKLFLFGDYKKRIEIWDIETATRIKEIEAPFLVNAIDVSHDGSKLLYWYENGNMVDTETGNILFEYLTADKKLKSRSYFCNHDSAILVTNKVSSRFLMFDTKDGRQLSENDFPKDFRMLFTDHFAIAPDTRHFLLIGYSKEINSGGMSVDDNSWITYYGTTEENKIKILKLISNIGWNTRYIFSDDLHYMYCINDSNLLKKYGLEDGRKLLQTEIVPTDSKIGMIFSKTAKRLIDIASIRNGEYLLITDNYNVSYFYSVNENKVKAWLYFFGNDYAFVTPDGRMDGTPGAIEKLQWVKGDQKIPLSATYDQMYTPNLMSQVFSNTLQENTVNLETIVKYTPEIKITNPKTEFKASSSALSVTCELKENGDEIKQVRIYVNDKLVSDETRGMKAAGNTVTYNVTLLPGINSVKAVAITKNGYQSGAAEVSVTYTGAVAESRLFVLAVGIDKYKNPAYNLNFAVADASAVVERIKSSGAGIFKTINIYNYQNESAKRDSILSGFDKIAAQAQPQDAFVLFYAGHGVMSEGTPETPKDFYLVLQNVTQIYGKDDLLKAQGISAAELREFSKKITAQKQVVFLDACQSGAAVETFAMRGVAEEKAILQLARSTGSYLIASTGSEQFATEFKELGHGVFTYAILQGLNCNADGSEKDKKVTIKELEAYLNDNIPTLTEKYHGNVQYPKSWSKGMDFPIAICK